MQGNKTKSAEITETGHDSKEAVVTSDENWKYNWYRRTYK